MSPAPVLANTAKPAATEHSSPYKHQDHSVLSQILKQNLNRKRKKHIIIRQENELSMERNETLDNLGSEMIIT